MCARVPKKPDETKSKLARASISRTAQDKQVPRIAFAPTDVKEPGIKHILLPIDFSRMSIQGIETAKRLGRRFGAAIHIAYVNEPAYPAGFMGPPVAWGRIPGVI